MATETQGRKESDQTPAETSSFADTLSLFEQHLALFPFDYGLALELAQGIPKTQS